MRIECVFCIGSHQLIQLIFIAQYTVWHKSTLRCRWRHFSACHFWMRTNIQLISQSIESERIYLSVCNQLNYFQFVQNVYHLPYLNTSHKTTDIWTYELSGIPQVVVGCIAFSLTFSWLLNNMYIETLRKLQFKCS